MSTDPSPNTRSSAREQLKSSVVSHYESRLREYGPTARGMDWKDEASQRLRFQVLCELCDLSGARLHDVGCGDGQLYDFLREQEIGAEYIGSDFSAEMVEAARSKHPDARFECWDILQESTLQSVDILVASGLFHVRLDHREATWSEFVEDMIRRMYSLCQTGIAFNMMSDQVDYRSEKLYYSNPGRMLDFCRRELSRQVVIRHDYPLFEYTVYVFRRAEG